MKNFTGSNLTLKLIMSAVLLAQLTVVSAQSVNSEVKGVITMHDGNILVGATISISPESGNAQTFYAASKTFGDYRVEVQPGLYTVEASMAGYQSTVRSNVSVAAGETVQIDITLEQ